MRCAQRHRPASLRRHPGQRPCHKRHFANRLVGQVHVGRARAKAAGRLQRVLEAHRGVPPVEHDRALRQRLVLQPPQPSIAVAQYRRRRIRLHT